MMPIEVDMRAMLASILRRLTILERLPSNSSGGGGRMAGEVITWAGAAPPGGGWLECNGASLLRADYPALFAAIGTTFGSADSTHFNLPDARGRAIVGVDASQTEFTPLGKTGGAKTHTLTIPEMPSHTHVQNPHTHNVMGALKAGGTGTAIRELAEAASTPRNDAANAAMAAAGTNQNTGGGGAHNNLQPYIAMRFFIKI